jgi:hypothetical protein
MALEEVKAAMQAINHCSVQQYIERTETAICQAEWQQLLILLQPGAAAAHTAARAAAEAKLAQLRKDLVPYFWDKNHCSRTTWGHSKQKKWSSVKRWLVQQAVHKMQQQTSLLDVYELFAAVVTILLMPRIPCTPAAVAAGQCISLSGKVPERMSQLLQLRANVVARVEGLRAHLQQLQVLAGVPAAATASAVGSSDSGQLPPVLPFTPDLGDSCGLAVDELDALQWQSSEKLEEEIAEVAVEVVAEEDGNIDSQQQQQHQHQQHPGEQQVGTCCWCYSRAATCHVQAGGYVCIQLYSVWSPHCMCVIVSITR